MTAEQMSEDEAERRLRRAEREVALLREYLGIKQGEARMLQLYLGDEEKAKESQPKEPPKCKKCGSTMHWFQSYTHPTDSRFDSGHWCCKNCGNTSIGGSQILWRTPPLQHK